MKNTLQNTYNFIFEESLINEILEISKIHDFKEGDIIIDFNESIKSMPLMLTGAIKILREDFDEGELLLYFIEKGDTCAMSMQCCLGNAKSEIRAIAETDGQLILIPVAKMNEWLGKYATWRNFVFNSYNLRLKEMLTTIDHLAFMNMDEILPCQEYKKAKERVMFKGFEHYLFREANNVKHNKSRKCFSFPNYNGVIIEDLISLEVELTESAIKQIGL